MDDVWENHKWLIISLFVIFIILSVVIGALIIYISRKSPNSTSYTPLTPSNSHTMPLTPLNSRTIPLTPLTPSNSPSNTKYNLSYFMTSYTNQYVFSVTSQTPFSSNMIGRNARIILTYVSYQNAPFHNQDILNFFSPGVVITVTQVNGNTIYFTSPALQDLVGSLGFPRGNTLASVEGTLQLI